MALNTKRLGRSQRSSKINLSGFFRLVDGKNVVRIFTFKHKVQKSDFVKGFYNKDDDIKAGKVFDELEREVPRHFTEEGVINCPKGDCEWCKEANELLNSKSKKDQKAGKQLAASKGFYVNLIDLQSNDREMQIGTLPSMVFSDVLSYVCDPEFGEDILGVNGRDFLIDRDSKQVPAKMYVVKIRDEKRCEKLEGEYEPEDLFNVSALEPGWSSNEDLNKYVSEETDNDKVTRITDQKAVESKENPFNDDVDKNQRLPWDKGKEEDGGVFELKDIVKFDDEEEGTLQGCIVELSSTVAAIQTGKKNSYIFDVGIAEITLVKKGKKSSGRRRS